MEAVIATAEKLVNMGPKAVLMLAIPVAFLVLTWFSFALRVYVRAFMIRSFGWDDWTMLITLTMFTSCCGLLITVEQIEHSPQPKEALEAGPLVALALEEKIMKYIITLMGLYILTTVTLKISLAIFFLRVVVKKWQRWVIYATVGLYTAFGIFFAFLAIFQCGNPNDMLIDENTGKCVNDNMVLQPLNYVHGSLNAVSDWIMAILPVLVLWRSNIPRNAKLSAGLLLSLGAIGSISSLVRLAYIPGLKNGINFFNNAVDIGIWSVIEPGLGIVAGCLATLRPLFRTMVEKTRNTSSNKSDTQDQSHSQDQIHDSKLSARRKAVISGLSVADRGYLQVGDKPPVMGNFTSVVGDMKSPTRAQMYELEEMGQTSAEQMRTRTPSTRTGSDPEINEAPPVPTTIGSLQNKAWFPDDEVLMTRHVNIYDEEACQYQEARRYEAESRYEEARQHEENRRYEEARRNIEARRYLGPRDYEGKPFYHAR